MSDVLVAGVENRSGWYALRVRHQNEFSVSDFFRKRFGILANVPSRKVWKRRNGVRTAVINPLLSTYVFIEAKLEAIEAKIMFSHKGVLGFLKNNGNLAVIPNEQVETLEKLTSSSSPVYDFPYSELKEAARVQVVAGPLAGALGQFVKVSPKTGHFIVSLDLFKRALVTEVESDLLKPY